MKFYNQTQKTHNFGIQTRFVKDGEKPAVVKKLKFKSKVEEDEYDAQVALEQQQEQERLEAEAKAAEQEAIEKAEKAEKSEKEFKLKIKTEEPKKPIKFFGKKSDKEEEPVQTPAAEEKQKPAAEIKPQVQAQKEPEKPAEVKSPENKEFDLSFNKSESLPADDISNGMEFKIDDAFSFGNSGSILNDMYTMPDDNIFLGDIVIPDNNPFSIEEAAEPVIEEEPEAVVEEAAEPVIEEEPEAVVEEAAEPVIEEEPEAVVEEAAEPVIEEEPEAVVEEAAEPVIEEEPEAVIEEAVEPVIEEEPEAVVEEAAEPVAEVTDEEQQEIMPEMDNQFGFAEPQMPSFDSGDTFTLPTDSLGYDDPFGGGYNPFAQDTNFYNDSFTTEFTAPVVEDIPTQPEEPKEQIVAKGISDFNDDSQVDMPSFDEFDSDSSNEKFGSFISDKMPSGQGFSSNRNEERKDEVLIEEIENVQQARESVEEEIKTEDIPLAPVEETVTSHKFIKSNVGDITIVTVNLDTSTVEDALEFKEYMMATINSNNVKLVVDLSETDYIDSTFLGALVASLKKVTAKKGELKLVCNQKMISMLFIIAGMDKIFKIFEDLDSAIKSFS